MKKHRNRLSHESSPYLLQHATNPVDWYAWGQEALDRARSQLKPIFLSIGYSACHWCHVMEKESFEDEATAKILNEHFISIKVDREERPDIDHIYMTAVQIMTQHGGWPLSVFLTPDLKPFYGGTYFPPTDRGGMPSFKKLLLGIATAWDTKRDGVNQNAANLTSAIQEFQEQNKIAGSALTLDLVKEAVPKILMNFDPQDGGFGHHPKFFHTSDLKVCLRHGVAENYPTAINAVSLTLNKISDGGIYDHLGGGFHRYSTDHKWLVPHFEKMLYDNALLVELLVEAYQISNTPLYAQRVHEILAYIAREMTSPAGGYYSTEDADSEGVEGKFYVWSKAEILQILGDDLGETFCKLYNVSEHGNWEETNILHLTKSLEQVAKAEGKEVDWLRDEISTAKRKLFAEREKRIHPHKDEKVLASWNGLMIHAAALAFQTFNEPAYLESARKAGEFVWNTMLDQESKKLLHTFKDGHAKVNGFLDDYACIINSYVTLYESEFQAEWIERATILAEFMVADFWDKKGEIFYYTAASSKEALITRPQETHDGAIPSATAMAITAMVRLGHLASNPKYLEIAEKALTKLSGVMKNYPSASGQLLVALENLMHNPKEIVVVPGADTEETEQVLEKIRRTFLPNKCVLLSNETSKRLPLLQGRVAVQNQTSVYVCENSTCQAPLVGLKQVTEWLDGQKSAK